MAEDGGNHASGLAIDTAFHSRDQTLRVMALVITHCHWVGVSGVNRLTSNPTLSGPPCAVATGTES